jgi:AcrR family transcriptional regulator
MRERSEARADAIVAVVLELLESEGYDSVRVRTVARRARVSLATIYKLFGTRDQLITTAMERWMDAHAYAELTMPEPGEPPYETMVRVLRAVFEPWEQHPRMLEAYYRAMTSGSGEQLVMHGMAVVKPIIEAALPDADPQYLSDVELVHGHVVRAVLARFANGEIAITEVLPILERTLYRLTTDNRLPATRRLTHALDD